MSLIYIVSEPYTKFLLNSLQIKVVCLPPIVQILNPKRRTKNDLTKKWNDIVQFILIQSLSDSAFNSDPSHWRIGLALGHCTNRGEAVEEACRPESHTQQQQEEDYDRTDKRAGNKTGRWDQEEEIRSTIPERSINLNKKWLVFLFFLKFIDNS